MSSNTIQLISACTVSLITESDSLSNTSSNSSSSSNFTNSPEFESSELEYEDESSEEEDYLVNSKSLNNIPGETKMALIIRTDLKMTKGKVAAQCAHAALGSYKLMSLNGSESENLELLKRWESHGQAKITLQCKSKDDLDLLFAKAISLNINSYLVRDAGRTQIEPGSVTVLALGPAPKNILDQVTGDLKLY
ncbi:hypothetical protein WICMUC_002635 [Wickerhamomyces mucosus]|uniref:peptidyl-tRNA hydrolase n=1 Tax=Wickerhamomyces mucosus TaxID=1378264 RepID=A0A9P8TEM2_9ASCO|nr:hypothetical protein WICMUC_002635 [Wickerhamomyces mucosus]